MKNRITALVTLVALVMVALIVLRQRPARSPSEERPEPDALSQIAACGQRIVESFESSVVRLEQLTAAEGIQSYGSGIVVSKDGHILTNKHVVGDATEMRVFITPTAVKGRVLGHDTVTDLALVKVQADDLQPISWGDSDELAVGELVWSLGCPFGSRPSLSFGIVSATRDGVAGLPQGFQGLLQTDAAMHPGSSGGPVVNSAAQVVGVNTASSGGHLSFAVPSNSARFVLSELLAQGRVRRGWLGATFADVAARQGVIVTGVTPDSPAQTAGLFVGDVIREWNRQAVSDAQQLGHRIAISAPDSEANLKVTRGEKTLEIQVRLAERPTRSGTFRAQP